MKADVKKLWVDALRSGDYEQGKYQLAKTGDDGVTRYCCLGVLCDLAVKAGVIDAPEIVDGSHSYADPFPFDSGYRNGTDLPARVLEWAGIDNPNPMIATLADSAITDYKVRASYANDSFQWTFERIAAEIEKNIPGEDDGEDASRHA